MRERAFATAIVAVVLLVGAAWARGAEEARIDLTEAQIRAIEAAAPAQAPAKPLQARKVLVYGRVPTHPDSVPSCFKAVEIMGRKSGAFEAVSSGDPSCFVPENLKQFDAIVMNNTHEATPFLPWSFKELTAEQQKAAKDQEVVLKKSFLDFISSGKGLVGIHGATCSVQWPEYLEVMGGAYGTHISGEVFVKAEEGAHPVCAGFGAEGIKVNDEIYIFREPYSRKSVRVLAGLDLSRTQDPQKRADKDYAVSWVRQYGKGRVFYCSLGHTPPTYTHRQVLQHMLAGIQFAMGDLQGEAWPVQGGGR